VVELQSCPGKARPLSMGLALDFGKAKKAATHHHILL